MKNFFPVVAALVAGVSFSTAEEVKLELTANDQMQFSTKELTAKTGDEVVLTLKHIGQLPAVAMGHNFVLLKPGTEIPAFCAKAVTAKEHDYIPQDEESKKLVIAFTKMLGGGESEVLKFTAPAPGKYPYVCTFPGHFALMQGTFTVTE